MAVLEVGAAIGICKAGWVLNPHLPTAADAGHQVS